MDHSGIKSGRIEKNAGGTLHGNVGKYVLDSGGIAGTLIR